MKQIYLLLFISALLSSCKNDNVIKEPKSQNATINYKNSHLNFTLEHPTNFEAIEAINDNIPVGFFIINDDTTQKYRENLLLNIEELPRLVPFDDYVTASKTQLRIMMPGIEIDKEDILDIDKRKVATFQYGFTKNEIEYTSKFYIISKEKRAYQFNSTCLTSSMGKFEKIFDSMIKSIKFQ